MRGELTDFSVTPAQWGEFLCRLFDRWVWQDVGKVFIQIFDATLANWVGVAPGICSMAPRCGHAAAMEYNGDLYSCDHFVFPEYRLGNIHRSTIAEMMASERQRAFGAAKRDSLPRQCRECRWLQACNGECPKKPILHHTRRRAGPQLSLCRLPPLFQPCGPVYGLDERGPQSRGSPAGIMDTPLAEEARRRTAAYD